MKDKLWKAVQSVIALAVFVGCIVLAIHIRDEIGKDKPRCYVCDEILWTKDDHGPLGDAFRGLYTCKEHWSRAQDIAQRELGYKPSRYGGPSRRDGALLQRIYEIIKDRRAK